MVITTQTNIMTRRFTFLVLFTVSSCNFSDDTKQLSGGWTFVTESEEGKVIVNGQKTVPCKVVQYGYNDDFIVALQKPTKDCFVGTDSNKYSLGKDDHYYWVIIHKQDLFVGPLSEGDFETYKIAHNIPDDLRLEATD
jgi:hypothetical protein